MAEEEPNSWMNMVWSTERAAGSELDLEDYAYEVLETAKNCLREDGYLEHGAFVITAEAIHCFQIGHKNWKHKQEIYKTLAEKAKELKAEAVITLADAYWGGPYDPATYYQGKLAEEGRECIWLSVTSPNRKSWSLEAKYKRIDDRIVFEPTERSDGGAVNLLGSWTKELREIQ